MSAPMRQMRRGHVVNYLLPVLGRYRLSQLNAVAIEKAVFTLELAAATKRHLLGTLRVILRDAERKQLIPFNPVLKVDTVRKDSQPPDAFTRQDLRLLFPAEKAQLLSVWKHQKYAAAFMVLASTGIRSGKLRALHWKHVVWDRGIIIAQAVKADGPLGPTKTNRSRAVPLLPMTQRFLRQWETRTPSADNGFVFPQDRKNAPLARRTLLDVLKYALIVANVPKRGRRLVVHSFRHTFNTLMRPSLSPHHLRMITGHTSQEMSEHYDRRDIESALSIAQHSSSVITTIWD